MIELGGNRDARSRALAEVARLDRRIAEGRAGWLSDEEAALVRLGRALYSEAAGEPPPGGTPGERLIRSATWRAYKGDPDTAHSYSPESALIAVATADEFPQLAANLSYPEQSRTMVDLLATKPRFSPLDFFTTIPTENRLVRGLGLASDEPAGFGLPDGAAAPEITLTAAGADKTLFRWEGWTGILRTSVMDDQVARRLIDEVLTRAWFRNLSWEALVGDGSTTGTRKQLRGVLNTAGVGTVAVAGGIRTDAVLTAIATVETGGFAGPHVLILNPTDKRELLGEPTWRRDRFPTLEAVIGFDKITPGVGYLGQVGAARLFSTPLMISVTPSHSDSFTRGIVTMAPQAFLDVDFPYPAAFCLLTGM